MNWLDKLEKKLGRFAIPNLTVYLLAGYVIGFAIYYLAPGLLGWLTLEPAYILRGQIWYYCTMLLVLHLRGPGEHSVIMYTFFQEYFLQ